VRVLVFSAGVIGSVYAGKLLQAGHEVVLVARGRCLSDLRIHGLVLQEAHSGQRAVLQVPSVGEVAADERYDLVLVLVPVRAEQLSSTLPMLTAMSDGSDVLFFGNTAGRQVELTAALGNRALFGFPAAGGVRDGAVIRYVLISQQKTMLGEPNGMRTPRVRHLHGVLSRAGFATRISADIDGWLVGHTAFVVPLAFALYRVGVDPARWRPTQPPCGLLRAPLGRRSRRCAEQATPKSPETCASSTGCRRCSSSPTGDGVLAGPRGELWFGAHTRAAPEEMRSLAGQLQEALRRTGCRTPDLDRLLATPI
jgi:2-dehydropantoate 2-reductase